MFPRFFSIFPPPPTAFLFAADLVLPLCVFAGWVDQAGSCVFLSDKQNGETQREKKEPCPRAFNNFRGRLEDRGVPKTPAGDRCGRQNPASGFQTA